MSMEQTKAKIEEYVQKAISNQSLSRLPQALAAFNEALNLAASINWAEKQIEILYHSGLILQDLGIKAENPAQVTEAINTWEDALLIAKRIGDEVSVATLHISIGLACAWASVNIEAIEHLSKAAKYLENVDFETAYAVLNTLGVLLSNANRADEAVIPYQQALVLIRRQNDLPAEAEVLANLSVAYEKSNQLPLAIEALEAYHTILFREGDVKASQVAMQVKRLKDRLKQARK
jgi:tetratricopeptide (TPR) repeat protein